jgi:hypothetical protein
MSFVPCRLCPNQCEPVFDRVCVSYLTRGHTAVMWTLLKTFTDPGPLTFQLQVGESSDPDADDWHDVGLPVTDQYLAHDPEQRDFGKIRYAFYRVVLTTTLGTYVSEPTGMLGTLGMRDWLKARNLVRRKLRTFRLGEGQNGFLLKRRITGRPCQLCLDPQTREVLDPFCPSCYGTGFQCGYYFPMACVWAAMEPRARHLELDGDQQAMRGTIADIVVQATMLLTALLSEEDIWVNKLTDDRYYVHKITSTCEIRGVPILGQVELRPIPFTSVIYDIPIPDQLAALGLE